MANRWGNNGNSDRLYILGLQITADGDCSHEIKRHLLLGIKAMTNLISIFKNRDITLPTNVRIVKAMVFPLVMYGYESWIINKAEQQRTDAWVVMVEKTLESPLDSKEIQPVHPKGNQSWIFIGRTNAEAEAPIIWPPDAGKDWRREEKETTEDKMVGWYHWLKDHEFQQASGVGDGKRSLVCCCSWGHKESDMTERLIQTELGITQPKVGLRKQTYSLQQAK